MVYYYDGSFPGFLTAVFNIFEFKDEIAQIKRSENQPQLFADSYKVESNEVMARRVWNGLLKKISHESATDFYAAYLSEKSDMENIMLAYLRYIFLNTSKVDTNFANPFVGRISNDSKMVYRERHRMEAFVRFKLTADGIYYAAIEPDFNVLPLLVKHFTNRYADQRWLIYDLKRKYGLYYDLQQTTTVEMVFNEETLNTSAVFHPDELFYQKLWRDYFTNANIVSRKNTKLHLRHVPLRYWKYLTEKN